MGLSSELISQFAKLTKPKTDTKKESVTYGTIVESDGMQYVKIDGSEILTPMTTTTKVSNGQRVTVMIKDHSAVVTGNITSPAVREEEVEESGKTATDYIGYDPDEGLTIGRKLGDAWEGFRTRITSSAYEILNAAGDVLASYGANLIELGKTSRDAVISMCANSGRIITTEGAYGDEFQIESPNITLLATDDERAISKMHAQDTPNFSYATVEAHVAPGSYSRMRINASYGDDTDGVEESYMLLGEAAIYMAASPDNPGSIDVTSETFTFNGVQIATLNDIGSGGGGDTALDLLWENPDTTVSFAAQEVTVPDMSPYAFIMYVYRYKNTQAPHLSMTVPYGKNAMLSFSAKNGTGRRFANYVDDNTISFEGGSNAGNDNDEYVIPYQIYGVSLAIMGRQLTTEDIVDNLESTEPLKLLSANQGRVLDEKIVNLKTAFQDGCDKLVADVTAKGVVPESNSPEDIIAAYAEAFANAGGSGGGEVVGPGYAKVIVYTDFIFQGDTKNSWTYPVWTNDIADGKMFIRFTWDPVNTYESYTGYLRVDGTSIASGYEGTVTKDVDLPLGSVVTFTGGKRAGVGACKLFFYVPLADESNA